MTGLNLCPYKSLCTPDCPKRCPDPNCHSTCPEYLTYRMQIDSTTPAKIMQSDINLYVSRKVERGKRHKETHTWKSYRSHMD